MESLLALERLDLEEVKEFETLPTGYVELECKNAAPGHIQVCTYQHHDDDAYLLFSKMEMPAAEALQEAFARAEQGETLGLPTVNLLQAWLDAGAEKKSGGRPPLPKLAR